MKDGRGFWVGDYWGVISFGVNRAVVSNVPKTWNDLLKPEYKNKVALNGSPLTSGSAVAGVYSAALANGGSLTNIGPGIDFFKRLKDAGNFIPVQATPQTIASGQTPITIDWDYLNLAYVKEFPAAKIAVVDPERRGLRRPLLPGDQRDRRRTRARRGSGRSSSTPTRASCSGSRATRTRRASPTWSRRKVVPKALLDALPAAALYAKVKFASAGQQDAGRRRRSRPSGPRRSARSAERDVETAEAPAAGAEPAAGVAAARWLGVAPVLRLRDPPSCFLPAGTGARRRVPGDGRRLHARQRRGALRTSPTGPRSRTASRSASSPRSLGGALGFLIAYSAIRDGTPRVVRSGAHDVLRRGGELRRASRSRSRSSPRSGRSGS